MKFKRRPLEVEAFQWDGTENRLVMQPKFWDKRDIQFGYVKTLEGLLTVYPGYWIITGANGEHWAVAPDIFEQTYEPIS